jgi:hypothetical protein
VNDVGSTPTPTSTPTSTTTSWERTLLRSLGMGRKRALAAAVAMVLAGLAVHCSLGVSASSYVGGAGSDAGSNPDSPNPTNSAAGGHVLIVGGNVDGIDAGPDSGLDPQPQVDSVWVAPIDSSGAIGAWTATWSLAVSGGMTPFRFGSVLEGSNYGPLDDQGHSGNVYEWAPFGDAGLLGPWAVTVVDTWEPLDDCTGPQFFDGSAFCYGGQFSVGDAGKHQLATDIYQRSINQTNHTLTPWTKIGATLTVPLRHSGVAAYASYVYVFGGCDPDDSAPLADVEWAKVDGAGAPVSAFATGPSLSTDGTTPYPICYAGGNVYQNFLYVWGGQIDNASPPTPTPLILVSVLDPMTGTPGKFSQAATLPAAVQSFDVFGAANHLYVVGGQDNSGAPVATIYSIGVNANGTLDLAHGWNSGTDSALPIPMFYPGAFAY